MVTIGAIGSAVAVFGTMFIIFKLYGIDLADSTVPTCIKCKDIEDKHEDIR